MAHTSYLCSVESLEQRLALAAGSTVVRHFVLGDANQINVYLRSDGVMQVVGSAGDDNLSILQNEEQTFEVDTTNFGPESLFDEADVKVIVVQLGAGNNSFEALEPLIPASVIGGAGSDRITVFNDNLRSGVDTIDAGDGDDTIYESGAAVIDGGNGNDLIDVSGRATVNGGTGADTIMGHAGGQTLYGDGGTDLISGGGGNDRLLGGAGDDRIYGGDGRDRIFGGTGDDSLRGGASGDWIYGNGGKDSLFGDGGNDRLYGDYNSAATLHGGAGDDLLVTRESASQQLFGDGGRDTAIADSDDVLTSIEA